MTTKLCVWGNSLGVRLPKYVVERTAVQPGDYLFITVKKAKAKSVVPTDAEVEEKW